jgi:uncharacterized protein (TIGR02594 family)
MTEPLWLKLARDNIGVREIPGPKHSTVILRWLERLGSWIREDETPWCGTFVAAMLQEAGQPVITHYKRARAWAEYGARLQVQVLSPGAIMVFWRGSPTGPFGHVGFYVGEDATHYHILGGNQSNEVNIQRIARNRLLASRWPRGVPVLAGPVRLSSKSAPTSTGNEV